MTAKSAVLAQLVQVVASEGSDKPLPFVADTLGAALLRDGGLKEDMGNGPWSAQAQVHQAAGMVIAQLGVGPEDALALLRAHAFADGASMAVIARAVVERRIDFSIEDDSRAFPS